MCGLVLQFLDSFHFVPASRTQSLTWALPIGRSELVATNWMAPLGSPQLGTPNWGQVEVLDAGVCFEDFARLGLLHVWSMRLEAPTSSFCVASCQTGHGTRLYQFLSGHVSAAQGAFCELLRMVVGS